MFKDFYDKYVDYQSDYNGGFSSHMPMVAYSLYDFGVPTEKIGLYLDKFIEKYDVQKEAFTVNYEITRDNYKEFYGKVDALGAYYNYFKAELNALGKGKLLNKYVPDLISGVAGRAFHPLIRLAFAVNADYHEEIIRAISYFAATYLPHKIAKDLDRPTDLLKAVNNLSVKTKDIVNEGSLIADKIEKIYATDSFINNIFLLSDNSDEALEQLDTIINTLYVKTKGFTVLHAVTSKEALKVLLPFIDKKTEVIDNYFIAILAAYVSVNAPFIDNLEVDIPEELPSFEEIITDSINTNNDHNIKLTYSCRVEYERSGNRIYPYMAYLNNGN